MEPESEQFKQRSREEEDIASRQAEQSGAQPAEFETPEELIRHDAARTEVPASVEARLKDSLANEPKPKPGIWKRLFGGGD
jgi:hypothetical protein